MKPAPPWSKEEIITAYFDDRKELEVNLCKLPGFLIAQKLKELVASYSIFQSATEDLFESIHKFKLLEVRDKLLDRHSAAIVEASVTAVRRGIFSACSASMALVDHTCRITKSVDVKGYQDEVNSRFVNSKLHQFIQGLRNYSIHRTIAETNWQVKFSFEKQTKSVLFIISKNHLLEWDEWKPLAKELIEETSEGIDVEKIFEEYAQQIADFNRWLQHKISQSGGDNYQGYLFYKNIIDGLDEYYAINMILPYLTQDAKANPDMYLDRFLTRKQLDVVFSIPEKSKERIDKIISLVDLHGACDNELRMKLYELFGVEY